MFVLSNSPNVASKAKQSLRSGEEVSNNKTSQAFVLRIKRVPMRITCTFVVGVTFGVGF